MTTQHQQPDVFICEFVDADKQDRSPVPKTRIAQELGNSLEVSLAVSRSCDDVSTLTHCGAVLHIDTDIFKYIHFKSP